MINIAQKLKTCRIGIAGAGGLGSNAAIALVRTGVENMVVADFDVVDASNLNRQYFFYDQIGMTKVEALHINALRINPQCNIETHVVKITQKNVFSLFSTCDLLIEALDKAEEKVMLIESVLRFFPEKPLIIGSGLGGWGKSNQIRCTQMGNIVICGDSETETTADCPPLAPRVGMVANMQANEALKILLG